MKFTTRMGAVMTLVVAHFLLLVVAQDPATTAPPSLPASPQATSSASAQTWTISVGIDHKFKPDVTQAQTGDIIEFQFFPPNHSVVRAEYGYPCIPYELTGRGKVGFFAGFHPVDAILSNPPTWRMRINDTDPIFVYCSAPGSCINYAMVGVINPNSTTSLQHQKDLARNASYMLQPGEDFPPEASVSPSSTSRSSTSATSTSTPTTSATVSASASAVPPAKAGLSTGAAAGIAVAGAAFLGLAAALLFFIGRARSQKRKLEQTNIGIPPQTPSMYQHHSMLRLKPGFGSPRSRESDMTLPYSPPYEYYVNRSAMGGLFEGQESTSPYYAGAEEARYQRRGARSPASDMGHTGWRRESMSNAMGSQHHLPLTVNPHDPQEMEAGNGTPHKPSGKHV